MDSFFFLNGTHNYTAWVYPEELGLNLYFFQGRRNQTFYLEKKEFFIERIEDTVKNPVMLLLCLWILTVESTKLYFWNYFKLIIIIQL